MLPPVSIIVVTKNEEKHIAECLDSLVAQDFPKANYEIIVIDGGSTDRTPKICQNYPVKLVSTGSGISHQRNTGISTANGKYTAFTDADCVVEKDWLKKLVDQMEKSDGNVVAVGGPNLVFDNDPPLSQVIGYAQETLLGSGGSPQSYKIQKARYVNSIPNCNILYRKEVIAEVRYDENISVGDDCELNFRLKQRDYRFLFLPSAIVWHHRPDTFTRFIRKIFSYGEAVGRITRKHKRIIRWYSPVVALGALSVIFSYPVIRLFPPAFYIYAAVFTLYIFALAISTAQVYKNYRNKISILTMLLLPLQHFVYGLGFLKGLLAARRDS